MLTVEFASSTTIKSFMSLLVYVHSSQIRQTTVSLISGSLLECTLSPRHPVVQGSEHVAVGSECNPTRSVSSVHLTVYGAHLIRSSIDAVVVGGDLDALLTLFVGVLYGTGIRCCCSGSFPHETNTEH